MLLIDCPFCGPRDETEFRYGGDASVGRPADPDGADDLAWTDYLHFRDNPKGPHREFWFHRDGCRQWLVVGRDTVSHAVLGVEAARR